jgi:hypothetical protein
MVGISIENCHIELPKRIEKWTYCKYEVNIIFNILETRFYLLGACLKSNIFFPAWNPAMVSYIILSIKYVYIYEYIYIWYIHISIYIYTFIDIQLQSRHIYIYIDAIYIYIYTYPYIYIMLIYPVKKSWHPHGTPLFEGEATFRAMEDSVVYAVPRRAWESCFTRRGRGSFCRREGRAGDSWLYHGFTWCFWCLFF